MKEQKEQKELAKRIEYLCNEKGMSHYRLSFKSAVPMTTVDNILRGKTKNPGIFTIMKLCNGLGVSIEEFFDCEEFRDVELEE